MSESETSQPLNGGNFLLGLLNRAADSYLPPATVKPAQNVSGALTTNAAPASGTSAVDRAPGSMNKAMVYGLGIGAAVLLFVLLRKK